MSSDGWYTKHLEQAVTRPTHIDHTYGCTSDNLEEKHRQRLTGVHLLTFWRCTRCGATIHRLDPEE